MCIAVFMWQAHPHYPFLLLFNRDEYYNRPTKAAGWWEGGQIVGGKDEVGGGTWLACSRTGKVAFLTNFRERKSRHHAKSRGYLPLHFLQSKKDPNEFAEEVIQEADQYNGFNLVLIDLISNSMVYVTNRPKEIKAYASQVSPGIHVLTNASLDSPWSTAMRLERNFMRLMKTSGKEDIHVNEMIEKLMMDKTKGDKSSLPGIWSPEFEYQLNSVYVDSNCSPKGRCGTRSSAAVLVKANGEVCFHERYLDEDSWKEHELTFQI